MRPPAFQFYADDFIGGTVTMTNEERGVYIFLLCLQWTQGGVSDDDLKRLGLGMSSDSLSKARSKFSLDETSGLLKNARLEAERQKQVDYRNKQAINGAKGGRPKGLGLPSLSQRVTQPQSQTEAKKSSPSPSPSPSNTKCKLKSRDEPASVLDLGEESKAPKPPRARDPLFDALAKADGSALEQLTAPAARAIGVALANIKRACPDLTAEEINRRAQNYRRAWPNATLTASALSKNWAKFGDSHSNLSTVRLGENLI